LEKAFRREAAAAAVVAVFVSLLSMFRPTRGTNSLVSVGNRCQTSFGQLVMHTLF
jgi:hypothetical protein